MEEACHHSKTCFSPLWLGLVLSCLTSATFGQPLLIDQSLQPPPYTGGNYHYDASIWQLKPESGQEFTPSLPWLDFVDVRLSNSSSNATGTFQIAIHSGEITNAVLGLSDPSFRFSGWGNSNTRFEFAHSVSLMPGNPYVLEVIQVAGNSGWGLELAGSGVINGQPINMDYGGGRLIYNGMPQEEKDIIFREGTLVPRLSTVASSQNLTLTWRASASNFVAEATSDLSAIVAWEAITNEVQAADGMLSLTVPFNWGNRFFRLTQQQP